MNDLISKCGIPGLRAVAGFAAALALAGTAHGQVTALTINGQTNTNNSTTLTATTGSTLTVKIDNINQPNRPYGLFVGLANNGANTGWFLAVNGGGKKPMPVVTGVATAVVEANYPPVDLSPDRPFNPNIHLDAGGHLTVSFLVPNTVVNQTYYFQAVVLKTGSSTATDVSNAIAVNFSAPTTAARVVCSVATAGSPQQDHAGFGVLQFTNGTPSSGVFTADPSLLDIRVDAIAMGDMAPWSLHSINGTGANRRARDVGWQSNKAAAFNADNYDYGRIELPPLPGNDGILGTSDDIPPRSVMRCYDNFSQEGFYLIVNKGPNPNTPGVDFIVIGRKKDSVPVNNSWKIASAFSPDGSRMSAIYDDSGSTLPQMFLIATDGSKPFNGNTTDVVDVTPAGTNNLFVKAQIFTNNYLWFVRDDGKNTDGGGGTDLDRQLYGVNIRAGSPTAAQVAIPLSPNYSSPQVDQIPDKAFVVSRNGGSTLCFVAGDVFTATGAGTPTVPDLVTKGDWYAVTELKPTQAVNLTTFPNFVSPVPQVSVYVAGDAYNGQSGYASLSPDGSKLALAVQHANEVTGTEEVYIYSTKDSNGDNVGDDAGTTKFNNPITNSGNFNHSVLQIKKTADLFMADNDHLFFFYDVWSGTLVKDMDLFSWNDTTKVIQNLTQTNGSSTFPVSTKGNIYPEGYFLSPNGKYFIFSRGVSSSVSKTNLVAVEIATGKLINITGSEFGGAKTSNTSNLGAYGENFDWHLSFAGGAYPSLCFFATTVDTFNTRNPWVFDANFPTAAIQLTTDTTANQLVESLTPSPVSLGCAWAWLTPPVSPPATTLNSDLEYQDLLYYFRDDLTETVRTGATPLGQFFFLRAGNAGDTTGVSPPALIAGFGDDNAVGDVDNPHDGKFYYFSLNGTTNYKFTNTTGPDAPGHQIGTTSGVICIYAVTKP